MIDYLLYLGILLLGIIVGFYRWKIMDVQLQPIVIYLLVTFIVESAAYYLVNISKTSPLFLYHFYTPILISILAWYFYQVIQHPIVKKSILPVTVLFVIISIYLIATQSLKEVNSSTVSIESVLLLLLSCFTIYESFEKMDSVRLTDEHAFWVSLGFAIFNTGTFIYFSLQAYLFREIPELGKLLFVLVKLLNFVLYPLLIIALICPIKLSKFTRSS